MIYGEFSTDDKMFNKKYLFLDIFFNLVVHFLQQALR